jgi:hypothetical protein
MENEVSVYSPKYYLDRYEGDPLKLTKEQYDGLERVLLDSEMKFVKIGDKIISTSSVKEVGVIKQREPFRAS